MTPFAPDDDRTLYAKKTVVPLWCFIVPQEARDYANRSVRNMVARAKTYQYGADKERAWRGYLGQYCTLIELPGAEMADKADYDLIYKGKRCEIKTIWCRGRPRGDDLVTVNSSHPLGQTMQKADLYIFLRILKTAQEGYIVGIIPPKDFFAKGRFVKKGEIAYYTPKGEPVRFTDANATILEIRELAPFADLEPWEGYRAHAAESLRLGDWYRELHAKAERVKRQMELGLLGEE